MVKWEIAALSAAGPSGRLIKAVGVVRCCRGKKKQGAEPKKFGPPLEKNTMFWLNVLLRRRKRRWRCFGSSSLIGRREFGLSRWWRYRVGIATTADDQRREQQAGQCETHEDSR